MSNYCGTPNFYVEIAMKIFIFVGVLALFGLASMAVRMEWYAQGYCDARFTAPAEVDYLDRMFTCADGATFKLTEYVTLWSW